MTSSLWRTQLPVSTATAAAATAATAATTAATSRHQQLPCLPTSSYFPGSSSNSSNYSSNISTSATSLFANVFLFSWVPNSSYPGIRIPLPWYKTHSSSSALSHLCYIFAQNK